MGRDGWREKGHSLLEVLASGNRRQLGVGAAQTHIRMLVWHAVN